MARVVALDHGLARCGVAVSDPTGTLATPVGVVERPDTRRGFGRLVALLEEREAERVVVGLPRTLRGDEGEQARAVRAFAQRLGERIAPVEVELWDERFTSSIAASRGGDGALDARAAAVILEEWLAVHGS